MTIINYLAAVDIPSLIELDMQVHGEQHWEEEQFYPFLRCKSMLCAHASSKVGRKMVISGFIACNIMPSGVYLSRLAVRPDMRRRDIGSSLIGWLRRWARNRPIIQILSDYPEHHEWFSGCQHFLRHNGFKLSRVVRSDKEKFPPAYHFINSVPVAQESVDADE